MSSPATVSPLAASLAMAPYLASPLHLATAHLEPATRPAVHHLALPLGSGPARWYWGQAGADRVLGWGAALRLESEGPDRFRRLAAGQAQALEIGIRALPGAKIAVDDLPWHLGFGFWEGPAWSGFPSALLVLPETGVLCRLGEPPLVWAVAPDPTAAAASVAAALRLLERGDAASGAVETTPPKLSPLLPADLELRIAAVLQEIRAGVATKVVLAGARMARRGDGCDWDALRLLERRMRSERDAFHYLMAPAGGLAWLGATPERLVSLRDDRLETMALAGSRPRGADPAVDAALGCELLASAKDRAEHQWVVEAIQQGLAALGMRAVVDGPRLRRLATLQHLETLVTSSPPPGTTLLDLVSALHPTPALGGWPKASALEVIARHESLPEGRGWYGGGVGWLDGHGRGDVSVGIRGLLVRGGQATAYAGAGLVEGSEPAAEAAEIAAKMAATLSALAAVP